MQGSNQRIHARHERRALVGKNLIAQREPVCDEIIERHRLPQSLVQHLQIHLRRLADQFLKQFRPDRQALAHNQLAERAINQALRVENDAVLIQRDRLNHRLHDKNSHTSS